MEVAGAPVLRSKITIREGAEMEERIVPERRSSILGSSQDCPVPMGVALKTTIEHGDRKPTPESFNLEITLLDIVRGREALDRIEREGVSDQAFKAGFEYTLVRIRFGYYRKARGPSAPPLYVLGDGTFTAASADGKIEYEPPSVVRQPQPELIGVPFSVGDSREGWIVLEVPEEEKKPLLVFHRVHAAAAYGVWGSVWFRLYAFDPMCIDSSCADCC
jgi:hypothetical protein